MNPGSHAISDRRCFSYTANGKPWVPTEWLSEVFLALAYRSGGWRALTAVAITPHFLARPHIFSYVLLAIWLVKLLDAYDEGEEGRLPSLRALVPLMVVWANLHGSFTFGLALLYIFASLLFLQGLRRRDRAACRDIVFTVCIVSLSSLATPYGVSAAFMTLELLDLKFTIPRIAELRSPDVQEHRALLFLLIGLLAAIAATGLRPKGARLIVVRADPVCGTKLSARTDDVLSYGAASVCASYVADRFLA